MHMAHICCQGSLEPTKAEGHCSTDVSGFIGQLYLVQNGALHAGNLGRMSALL